MEVCAFDKGRSCAALNERECENCTFRKTQEELTEGREKALARIKSLPRAERKYIMKKYYRRNNAEVE